MNLPPVAPHVVAAAVEALPARLRSRLDAMVEQARQWPVETTADGGAKVSVEDVHILLTVPVDAPERATCTCLLAPKCLHRAAILSCAPILDSAPPTETQVPQEKPAVTTPLTEPERAATQVLWSAAIPLLEKGIDGADAIAQADLLRAVHGARQVGLHRPAAAATAVVRRVRAARAKEASFRLGELTDDLRDLLTTCHRLSKDDGTARGVARRDYEPVGDLKLYGLLCEPLRTASGYAGVATILTDDQARIWTVADVRPGEQDRVRMAVGTAAEGAVEIGEIRISHRELSRAGLLTPGAVASADGRLSHGRKVQAVRSAGCDWYRMPVLKLWQMDVAAQVTRWVEALRLPVADRPGGHDLAFLDGVVVGAGRRGLLMAVEGVAGPVWVAAPWEDPSLPHVANLRQLAENATGQQIRLVGRFAGPRLVHGLGFSAQWLPEHFGGHVALGVDRLQKADMPGSVEFVPLVASPDITPPLDFARHAMERVVAAGRSALLGGVAGDARRLAEAQLGTGAELLKGLGAAGTRRGRDVFGRLDPHDSHRLARAWLAVAVYEQAAGLAATRDAWLPPQ